MPEILQTIFHYRIVEKLGGGGMGVVYKADNARPESSLALKFIRSEAPESKQHKTQFLCKVRAHAALEFSNSKPTEIKKGVIQI